MKNFILFILCTIALTGLGSFAIHEYIFESSMMDIWKYSLTGLVMIIYFIVELIMFLLWVLIEEEHCEGMYFD